MLVPFIPNTSTSGGQTRWYNIIKLLSKKHDITLFTSIKDDSEKKYIKELRQYCSKVRVFRRSKSPWTIRNILLSVLSPFPLLLIRNFSFKERIAVKKELEKEDYDLIHAETFYIMPHIPQTEVPSVQVEQTIWHKVYEHHVKTEINPFLRPFFMLDVFKLKYWEVYFWKKATKLFTVSPDDKLLMEELIPGEEIEVIPNGVDSSFYDAKKIAKKSPPRVMYGVTNFEWLQNVEAVDLLINEVWPSIRKEVKGAKLWIVGRKIPQRILDLAEQEDIEVTESIPDARDAYKSSTVMVTPIRGAGGTRLKILEAMAAGLPVVSTSVGVAGLNVVDGKEVLIDDDMKGLAKQTVKLLKNKKLASKIGNNGKKYVEKNFDWKAIDELHNKIYKKLLKNA